MNQAELKQKIIDQVASFPDYKGGVQRIFKNFKPYNLADRKSEEDKLRENIKYYAKNKRVKDVAYIVVFFEFTACIFLISVYLCIINNGT